MLPNILMAPGFNGSDDSHWQTCWEKSDSSFIRVEQDSWTNPICQAWVTTMNNYIVKYNYNVLVVAHSLACITLVHWVAQYQKQIKGALLVAPPDVERLDFHKEVQGFAPIPLQKMLFKTMVVASANDKYITLERSMFLAEQWGSEFVNARNIGHINSQSNIGEWVDGKFYLEKLKQTQLNSVV